MNEELPELFKPNASPYMNMFTAGRHGIPLEEVISYCSSIGIELRDKDIRNWSSGYFRRQMTTNTPQTGIELDLTIRKDMSRVSLSELPEFPSDWIGCERRFFPCNAENKPMMKWGWSETYYPELYNYADALALSPVGYVGQNMLYQKFVVIDIDGRGHGRDDDEVIEFGRQLASDSGTMVMEDPSKLGSFHLYFRTNHIIPVQHYNEAKIDFMGNAVNAAVYIKNKLPNGKEPVELTEEYWKRIISYVTERKVK